MKNALLLIMTLTLSSWSSIVFSESAEEKGFRIAKASKALNIGWNDSEMDMEMHLFDREGNQNIRTLRVKVQEVLEDGDKSLTVFDEPKDIKGTRFLNFSHALKSDEQWIFLPALKRVKRISSRNKSGPFLGSEFSYEDTSSFEVEKYNFVYIKKEPCGELTCHVIKFIPLYADSGYTYMTTWIDTTYLQHRKVDYYDRKGSLLKTMMFDDYKLYSDKYWRVHKQTMVNHQSEHKTILKTLNYTFNVGLDDSIFSHRGLKRKL